MSRHETGINSARFPPLTKARKAHACTDSGVDAIDILFQTSLRIRIRILSTSYPPVSTQTIGMRLELVSLKHGVTTVTPFSPSSSCWGGGLVDSV